MVNVGLGWSSIVGILLAASGLALYFLRSFRPKLARDHDIFFAAVALLCGGILFFQGWRQDPILQFGQFLLTGSAVFFAVESIRLRSVTTEQAKRTTPIVDDERPVSRVYKAELDDLEAFDQRSPVARRIRGSRDTRPERDEYDEGARRRTSTRPNPTEDDRYEGPGNSRRRRPRADEGGADQNYFLDEDRGPTRRGRGRDEIPPESPISPSPSPRSRRPRSSDDPVRPRGRSNYDEPPSQYVEYRPVDNRDDDNNWGDE